MTTKSPVRLPFNRDHQPTQTTGKLGILIHFNSGGFFLQTPNQPVKRLSPSEVAKLTHQPTDLFLKKK
jgi:hypothetical protein